jgi:hypothetical protein
VHKDLKILLGKLEPFSTYVSEEEKRRKGMTLLFFVPKAEVFRYTDEERREFLSWLSDIDYRGDHDANSRNILKGSGDWMLNSEEKFRKWKQGGGLLWLYGIRQ